MDIVWDIKNKLRDQRGEIATIVALIGLGVVTAGIFAANRLVKTGPRDFPLAATGSVNIYPKDDTYVNASSKTSNYCKSTLQVDGNPVKIIYLKFDLTQITFLPSSAKLWFRVTNSSGSEQNVKEVLYNDWSECGLNYNNKPDAGPVVAKIPGGKSGNWISVDITDFVRKYKGKITSLAIDSSGGDGLDFYSKENVSYKPYIEIGGSIQSVTATKTPTKIPTKTPTKSPTPVISRTPTPSVLPTAVLTQPVTGGPPAGQEKIYPTDDTYVNGSYRTSNYCRQDLMADGSPVRITYMKFDLSRISSSPVSAKLWLKVTGSSAGRQRISAVSNNSWSECSLNYNNRPSLGTTLGILPGGRSGDLVGVDLTEFVKNNSGKTVSIAIDTSSSDGIAFHSKENAIYKPYIEYGGGVGTTVTQTPPTATKTPVEPTVEPSVTPEPSDAEVYFIPENTAIGPARKVQIMVNSGDKQIAFARVVFNFDKLKLKLASEITTNPALSTVVHKTNEVNANGTGRIVIVAAAPPQAAAPNGEFELASFDMDAVQANSGTGTMLQFDTGDSQIVDAPGNEVLTGYTNITLSLTGQAVPSPTVFPHDIEVYFEPANVNLPPSRNVKIMVKSENFQVAFARAVFKFDPAKVKLTSEISTNSNLSTVVEKSGKDEANERGKVTIVLAGSPSDIVPSGVFELASFSVDANSSQQNISGNLTFEPSDSQLVDKTGPELIPLYKGAGLTINAAAGGACTRGPLGNLDCSPDGCIDTSDFELFRQYFGKTKGEITIASGTHTPDLVVDQSNMIDTADYEIIRSNFGSCQ